MLSPQEFGDAIKALSSLAREEGSGIEFTLDLTDAQALRHPLPATRHRYPPSATATRHRHRHRTALHPLPTKQCVAWLTQALSPVLPPRDLLPFSPRLNSWSRHSTATATASSTTTSSSLPSRHATTWSYKSTPLEL